MIIQLLAPLSSSLTYTELFTYSLAALLVAIWLVLCLISRLLEACARKMAPPNVKDSMMSEPELPLGSINESQKILLADRYQSNRSKRKESDNFYETENHQKNQLLRYLHSLFSWACYFTLACLPTIFSGFGFIPLWAGILGALFFLTFRYFVSLYRNCPISVKKKRSDHKLYKKVFSTMAQLHPKKLLFGYIAVILVSVFINLATYRSCINDHVLANFGILFNNKDYIYSTAMTRFFDIDDVCPPGPPCHVYATLPFDTSSGVFLNVHTNIKVTNFTVNYDTADNYNTNKNLKEVAYPTYMISPSGYDSRGERNIHTVSISGLAPDTTYIIQISYDNTVQYNNSYITLPAGDSTSTYNLIYGGDLGTSSATVALASLIADRDPRAMVIGGDIFYDNGEAHCYYSMDLVLTDFESLIFAPMQRIVPFILAVGNHDVGFDSMATTDMKITDNGPSYYTAFAQHASTNGDNTVPQVTDRKTYHAHMIGNILNVALDAGYVEAYDGEQLDWLRNISAQYPDSPKIAIYHDPIFSPCNDNRSSLQTSMGMINWIPQFDHFNYMGVFEHHMHTYKRTFPIKGMAHDEKGTIYFGDGDWGVKPSTCAWNNETGIYSNYGSVNHVWVVTVNQGTGNINYQALAVNTTIIDNVNQDMSIYSNGPMDTDL